MKSMGSRICHAVYINEEPFKSYFPKAEQVRVVHAEDLNDSSDILVLWGGEDISPSIYGRESHRETSAAEILSRRDLIEVRLAARAIELGMRIFGVCRGAQLGCALAGGILVQHVENHTSGTHMIEFKDGTTAPMTSVHHQMMYPWDVEHELFAWTPKRSRVYLGITPEEREKIKVDPEIVYFPKIKLFAVQGHPEVMHPGMAAVKKTMEIFNGLHTN